MAFYECTLVARADLSRADVQKITDQFSKLIADQGGRTVKNEYWGLRSLAYRIRKNRRGHYAMLAVDAPAAAIKEMERNMRINEDVIRGLTIRVDAHEEGPSVMMQAARGDERPSEGEDAVEAVATTETIN